MVKILIFEFRSCEWTMKVLRSNKDSLMTILEVLMYDPLYNWSMTPEKAKRIQRRRVSTEANNKAEVKSEIYPTLLSYLLKCVHFRM